MTPFRASWPGGPEATLMPDARIAPLRAEALQALEELCRETPAPDARPDAIGLLSKAEAAGSVTEGAELQLAIPNGDVPLHRSRAGSALRLAADLAAQLGLDASLRHAADAAAKQLRIWIAQDAALMAAACIREPARSRTVSGSGMFESNIRLSTCGSTGTGPPQNSNASPLSPPRLAGTVGVRLTGPPSVWPRAAATVVWSLPWADHKWANAVLCWPQCSAAASEKARLNWQKRQHHTERAKEFTSDILRDRTAYRASNSQSDGASATWTHADADTLQARADEGTSKQTSFKQQTVRPGRCAALCSASPLPRSFQTRCSSQTLSWHQHAQHLTAGQC